MQSNSVSRGDSPAPRLALDLNAVELRPGYYTVEGTYDAATKTLTATMEGPDPSGSITRTKETTVWKDADNRVFTMYAPDGKTVSMRISYKRRK